MTPEEIEIRENYDIRDEDILQIPALAMWELCRQFNSFVDTEPFPTYLGDYFYRFYCNRIKEFAMHKVEERVALNDKAQTGRGKFDREEAIAFFRPGTK